MNLNDLARTVHQANIAWWRDPVTGQPIQRNKRELLALVISEISECLEGERKDLMDDKLPHRKMAEVELADAKIRLLDFAGGFRFQLSDDLYDWPLPDNKGEYLFLIMKEIAAHDGFRDGSRINHAISMIGAYARHWGYDLDGAFKEKMLYNSRRPDHTHEARRLAGGKKF